MSTKVTRQTVTYYLPDSPSREDFVENTFYNNTINCLLTNISELDSINAVTDNEISRKSGSGYDKTITQTNTTSSWTNYNALKNINNSIQKTNIVTANDIGIIYNIAQLLLQQMNSKTDKYWTTCQMVCQTACQATCQLACQSCYGGTCHDKHCGGGF